MYCVNFEAKIGKKLLKELTHLAKKVVNIILNYWGI